MFFNTIWTCSSIIRRIFLSVDVIWIPHYTLEIKEQSKQWMEAGERAPKGPKTQQSAGKVMATVFWCVKSIIHIDYLKKGKTIIAQYYSELPDRFDAAIKVKHDHIWYAKKSSFIKIMHWRIKQLKQ